MKQYSFGTFLVDDANRAAYELCRDIANLQDVEPMPVVLVADKGCGKTHLLYSIVNRVRATSADTGLAYVTARNFHPRVRALVHDPAPLQQAASAILLVDQLEAFRDHADELEAVVRTFLHYGHPVVMASSAHPGRLSHLPAGLLDIIEQGQTHEIIHHDADSRAEMLHRQIREELEARIQQQDTELAMLRARGEAAEHAREEIEHLKAELALRTTAGKEARQLRDKLEAAKLEVERLKADADHGDARPSGHDEHDAELEALRAQLSLAQQMAEAARAQLEEARHTAEEAQAENAELWTALDDPPPSVADPEAEAERERLTQEIEALRAEAETLRARLDEVEKTPPPDQTEIEALRAQLEEAREEQKQAAGQAEAEAARAAAQEALEDLATQRRQFEDERRALEQSHAEALRDLETRLRDGAEVGKARERERDEARREAAALRDKCESLKALTERLAQQTRASREEADEARREADTLAAAAEEEGRAADHRIAALQADLDFTRDSGRNVGLELAALQRRLGEAASVAADLGRRLTTSMGEDSARAAAAQSPSAQPVDAEAAFFGDAADDADAPPFPAGFAVAADDPFLEDDDEIGFDLGRFDIPSNEQDRLAQPFTPLNPRDLEVPSSERERKAGRHPFRGESEAV